MFEESRKHGFFWVVVRAIKATCLGVGSFTGLGACIVGARWLLRPYGRPNIRRQGNEYSTPWLSIRIVFRSSFKISRQQAQGIKATGLVSRPSFDKSRQQWSSFEKLRQHVRGIKATGLVFGSSFEQSRQRFGGWAPSWVLGLALLVLDGCFVSMVPPIYTSRQ